eukprot:TRINITY_DN3016_c0_g4_i3.p1 TRINITY_DN3016_c0_g4~~TRINITY_DN3016_c0_g4_i3.p1  ORF type:complete len:467 (-),score=31.03 TRINITY_DN3016_c0_g4_i3:143-1516(-)
MTNLKLILAEWGRKQVHRDVRITILNTAFKFLTMGEVSEAAWEIFESGTKLEENEILVALLAAKPFDDFTPAEFGTLVEKSRLLEFYSTQSSGILPTVESIRRYASTITLKIAETAKDEDVTIIALASMHKWELHCNFREKNREALLKVLCSPDILSDRANKQKVLDNRFKHFLAQLWRNSQRLDNSKYDTEPFLKVLTVHCEAYKKAADDWILRPIIRERINYLLSLIPTTGPHLLYSAAEEAAFLAQLKPFPEFEYSIRQRKLNVYLATPVSSGILGTKESRADLIALFKEEFEYGSVNSLITITYSLRTALTLYSPNAPNRKELIIKEILSEKFDAATVHPTDPALALRLFLAESIDFSTISQHIKEIDIYIADLLTLASREDLATKSDTIINSLVELLNRVGEHYSVTAENGGHRPLGLRLYRDLAVQFLNAKPGASPKKDRLARALIQKIRP